MQGEVSGVAVTFQAIGTLLLALMMGRLGRMFSWKYPAKWGGAWVAMFIGIASVRIYIATSSRVWWGVYLLAEWTFLLLFWTGCRLMVRRGGLEREPLIYLAPLCITIALVIVRVSLTFNDLFMIHAALFAALMWLSFNVLGEADRRTGGWQTMRISVALLATLYTAYVPLFWIHTRVVALSLLGYSSFADLLGCVVLGFGMILVTAEEAVLKLERSRNSVEMKMRVDPLTEALNRHAFQTASGQSAAGSVFMIDIDHLKRINDTDGHPAGDAAIRAAANAIRQKIRADDLLFRWGGDEFLVIVPNTPFEMVSERLALLREGVEAEVPVTRQKLLVTMSFGGAEFGSTQSLEEAIRLADADMYQRRVARRGRRTPSGSMPAQTA